MRLMLLAAVCGLSLTVPAAAQDSSTAAPAKPAKEKKICHLDTGTGSIVPKRVCHTRAEWAEIEKQNANSTDRYTDQRDHNSGR